MSATLLAMVVNITQSRAIVLVKIMSKTSRSLRRSSEHFFLARLPGKNFSQNYVEDVAKSPTSFDHFGGHVCQARILVKIMSATLLDMDCCQHHTIPSYTFSQVYVEDVVKSST